MANSCFFNARIAGKKEDVDKVFDFIKEHACSAEVYDTEEESEYEEDFYISGEVKWSLSGAWNFDKLKDIEQIKKEMAEANRKAGLPEDNSSPYIKMLEYHKTIPSIFDIKGEYNIEAYSEETGNEFQEHIIIKNGDLILDDSRSWHEKFDIDSEISTSFGGYKTWDYDFVVDKQIDEWNGESEDFFIL